MTTETSSVTASCFALAFGRDPSGSGYCSCRDSHSACSSERVRRGRRPKSDPDPAGDSRCCCHLPLLPRLRRPKELIRAESTSTGAATTASAASAAAASARARDIILILVLEIDIDMMFGYFFTTLTGCEKLLSRF